MSFLGEDSGVELTKWRPVLVDQDTFQTSHAGHLLGG